jgi:2-polyprenyl-3-methyl-5-hydroxy-6-metoxy-1,4-benzoquinol methylase
MNQSNSGVLEREAAVSALPCNLCDSVNINLVSNLDREKQYLRTVICKECGLVFTDNKAISDIKQFYIKEYRGKGSKPALKHILRHGNNALKRYAILKKHLKPGQKVFDIGSGSGEFVYLLQYLGFKAKGIEPHQRFANYCKTSLGVDIEINFLEEFAATCHETFDVVTIFHVLEHKENPFETLSIMHGLLNPDGLCVVEVPNISSYALTPKNLFHLDHLFNFNNVTLTRLGEKAGFVPVETVFSQHRQNITVIFRKSACLEQLSLQAPENYRTLFHKLKNYTDLKHYCTLTPYARLIRKGLQYLKERQFASQFNDGKTLLDTLFKNRLSRL